MVWPTELPAHLSAHLPANLPAFILASLLVILVPGPATLFVATRPSRPAAAAAVLGIVAGDLVLIGLAALGVGALLQQWPLLLGLIKLLGAAYLVYLGMGLLRPRGQQGEAAAPPEASLGFAKGLAITLSNPKPLLFFGAFFPMFIPAQAGPAGARFLVLGLIFELINLAYFGTLVGLIARVRRAMKTPGRAAAGLRVLAGLGLIGCAALMLLSAA